MCSSARNLEPIRVENAWEAIIDRDTFEQVQVMLKGRARAYLHPRRVASHYLLSGLARCGYCGKALVGQDAKGGKFKYYVCGTLLKKGSGSCQAHYINSQRFERLVIDKIKEHILTEENLTELVCLVNEEMDASTSKHRQQLDALLTEISRVNQRLERLYDALETGMLQLADLAPRIQRLRQRQEQLETRRLELEYLLSDTKVELADMKTVARYVADLRNLLSESPLAERKSFIKSFVKEVKVIGTQVRLIYTIPMPPKGVSQETVGVPPIVHYGGAEGTRTPDLLLAKEALSQLSYSPIWLHYYNNKRS